MLPGRAIPWRLNALAFHPTPECVAVEDTVAVADDVLWFRGATDRWSQKRTEFAAVRPRGKHADAHDAAGEMVDDHTNPPAERELLRQCKGQPRDPESQTRRYGGQINVPSVIAASGDDLSPGGRNAAIWPLLVRQVDSAGADAD